MVHCINYTQFYVIYYTLVVRLWVGMLGGSDDVAAVLSVLDKLSGELATNRDSLNDICTTADSFGGGAELPAELVYASMSDIRAQIHERETECIEVKQSLESTLKSVIEAAELMRSVSEYERQRQREVHNQAAQELLDWQQKVESIDNEKAELRAQQMQINGKLSELYARLNSTTKSVQ